MIKVTRIKPSSNYKSLDHFSFEEFRSFVNYLDSDKVLFHRVPTHCIVASFCWVCYNHSVNVGYKFIDVMYNNVNYHIPQEPWLTFFLKSLDSLKFNPTVHDAQLIVNEIGDNFNF